MDDHLYFSKPIPARDLLDKSMAELVGLVETEKKRSKNGPLIAFLNVNYDGLDPTQRSDLEDRLCQASDLVACNTANGPVSAEELFSRLEGLTVDEDGTVPIKRQPVPFWGDSDLSPMRSDFQSHVDDEMLCHEELLRNGGRPACSVARWIRIIDHPDESYAVLLPWLSNPDDATSQDVQERRSPSSSLQKVFSAQLQRWWAFEKWRLMQRDIIDGDSIGRARYLESEKRRHPRLYEQAFERAEKNTRKEWENKDRYIPARITEGGRPDFVSYHKALKKRLAAYAFQQPLQLRRDPRKQSARTTWLEYLVFELLELEPLELAADVQQLRYNEPWKRFSKTMEEIQADVAMAHTAARSEAVAVGRLPSLAAFHSEPHVFLGFLKSTVASFVQDTASYHQKQSQACQQRARIRWIVKEAHRMEKEDEEEREKKLLKSEEEEEKKNTENGATKRRLDMLNGDMSVEAPSLRRSKRNRGDESTKTANAKRPAAPGPTTRRNTKRLRTS